MINPMSQGTCCINWPCALYLWHHWRCLLITLPHTSANRNILGEGSYRASMFEDGVNAGRDVTDYKKAIISISAKDKLTKK
jgi:hypothetical protein